MFRLQRWVEGFSVPKRLGPKGELPRCRVERFQAVACRLGGVSQAGENVFLAGGFQPSGHQPVHMH